MLSTPQSPRASGQYPVMSFHEPTIAETLSDPIVQTMMRADGVDRRALEAMLTSVSAHLVGHEQKSAASSPSGLLSGRHVDGLLPHS